MTDLERYRKEQEVFDIIDEIAGGLEDDERIIVRDKIRCRTNDDLNRIHRTLKDLKATKNLMDDLEEEGILASL